MSRTVFILGAGASHEGGGPLMTDFLHAAQGLVRRRRVGDVAAQFELVLRARDSVRAVHAKAMLDVGNVESVFGAFEMGRILRRLGPLTPQQIDQLGPAMRVVIASYPRTVPRVPTGWRNGACPHTV